MNKNIKQLIEDYIQAFNPADIQDNRPKSKLPKEVRDYLLYEYYPKNRRALINDIISLLDKGIKNLNCIDVSRITDFSMVFAGFRNNNRALLVDYDLEGIDISKWDVSRGENFSAMFASSKNFNCDISGWNVSSGENFNLMFSDCTKFNQDLSGWNVSSGKSFDYMFSNCSNLEYYDDIKLAWEANYDVQL